MRGKGGVRGEGYVNLHQILLTTVTHYSVRFAKAIGVSNSLIFNGIILIVSLYQRERKTVKQGSCIVVNEILLYILSCLLSYHSLM